jgi:hypothetical protein
MQPQFFVFDTAAERLELSRKKVRLVMICCKQCTGGRTGKHSFGSKNHGIIDQLVLARLPCVVGYCLLRIQLPN